MSGAPRIWCGQRSTQNNSTVGFMSIPAKKFGTYQQSTLKVGNLISSTNVFDSITIGWGRRIAYCIAFSVDGATDVTRRYVRDFAAYGRSRSQVPEESLIYILREIQTSRRAKLDEQEKSRLVEEDLLEEEELQTYIARRIIDKLNTITFHSANNDLLIKRPTGMFLPIS